MSVTLIANRQLVGDWGNVPQGGYFETNEEEALELESRGLATRWQPPLTYETKIVVPEGAKPAHPNKMYAPKERKSGL